MVYCTVKYSILIFLPFFKELIMVIPHAYLPFRGYFLFIIQLLFITFFSLALFTSCTVTKPSYPFKDITRDTIIKSNADINTELKIQKNDLLSLVVGKI